MRGAMLAALGTAGLLMLSGRQPLPAQQVQVNNGNRTISITASQTAERRADRATLHIGYQVYGATSAAVNQQASEISAAIVKATEQQGVAKDAIASDNQSTGPVEGYQQGGLTPEQKAARQFQAEQSWSVRTTPGDAANVLAAAVSAGANQSGAIDWTIADESSLSAEAAAKALMQAKQIAAQMAAGLGVKVGALLYASNESQQPIVMAPSAKMLSTRDGPPPTIAPLSLSPPMIDRSATVTAIFSIE